MLVEQLIPMKSKAATWKGDGKAWAVVAAAASKCDQWQYPRTTFGSDDSQEMYSAINEYRSTKVKKASAKNDADIF